MLNLRSYSLLFLMTTILAISPFSIYAQGFYFNGDMNLGYGDENRSQVIIDSSDSDPGLLKLNPVGNDIANRDKLHWLIYAQEGNIVFASGGDNDTRIKRMAFLDLYLYNVNKTYNPEVGVSTGSFLEFRDNYSDPVTLNYSTGATGTVSTDTLALSSGLIPPDVCFIRDNNSLYARDHYTIYHRLTSHKDPRDIQPDAITSFQTNPEVLPFSIHHYSQLTGQGAVIDIMKMVKYLEEKMQDEYGEEAGKLIFDYSLPEDEAMSYDQWLDYQILIKLKDKMNQNSVTWKNVDLGPDGSIPAEAVEYAEEYQVVENYEVVEETKLDLDQMKVKKQYKTKKVQQNIPTGRTRKQLKSNYKFENGQLMRRNDIEDIDIDEIVESIPELPDFILQRMSQENVASLDKQENRSYVRQLVQKKLDILEPYYAQLMDNQ